METGAPISREGNSPPGVSLGLVTPIPATRPGGRAINAAEPHHTQNQSAHQSTEEIVPVSPSRQASVGYAGPTIALINQSTILHADQVTAAVEAMQIQLDRDFAPAWGTTANLRVITDLSQLGHYDWLIGLLDDSDQAGALGYHDVTGMGQPIGKVFARTDIENGLSWTVTLSHELLEMVMDPYITTTMFDQTSNTGGRLYAFEMCDPCEADDFGYQINGQQVSDFVLHTWFEGWRDPGSIKFDFTNKLQRPLSVGFDGYMSVFPIPNRRGWAQVFGQSIGRRLELKMQRNDSRTFRRMRGSLNAVELPEHQPVLIREDELDQEFAT